MNLRYSDTDGRPATPWMACSGIGITRCLQTFSNLNRGRHGLRWAPGTGPADVHLSSTDRDCVHRRERAAELVGGTQLDLGGFRFLARPGKQYVSQIPPDGGDPQRIIRVLGRPQRPVSHHQRHVEPSRSAAARTQQPVQAAAARSTSQRSAALPVPQRCAATVASMSLIRPGSTASAGVEPGGRRLPHAPTHSLHPLAQHTDGGRLRTSAQQRTHHVVTRHTLLLLAPGAFVVSDEPADGIPEPGREPADDLDGGHPQSTLDLREIVRRDSARAATTAWVRPSRMGCCRTRSPSGSPGRTTQLSRRW